MIAYRLRQPDYEYLFYNTAAEYATKMAEPLPKSVEMAVIDDFDSLSYNPTIQFIKLPVCIAFSKQPKYILSACHEVAHAIDHQRWPWLFRLRKRTRHIVLGYLINLFLEWHASKLALRYLRNTGNFSARQIDEMQTLARKAFKTYL